MQYTLFFMMSLASLPLQADFSFKNIVSYVMPKTQEEIVTYENRFDSNGILEVEAVNGSITIKAWKQEKIMIEATKKGAAHDIEHLEIDARINEKTATIISKQPPKMKGSINYVIIVPHTAPIKVRTNNGSITVNHLHGPITARTAKGAITIHDATNSVRAHSAKGALTVSMRSIEQANNITLESQDGAISLSLPEESKATLSAHTIYGKVFCDLLVTLHERTTHINHQFWDSLKKEVVGTINGGGTPIHVTSNTGTIRILEYY